MKPMTVGLRVTAAEQDQARVSVRRHQFVVGRPIDFDAESSTVMALEYALGALGAELVGGLRQFAGRRRLVLDNVEALVQAEIEDSLVYLEVIGESGQPRIGRVDIRVYVASPETEQIVRQLFEDVLINPKHREMMDLEGLKAWLPGRTSGFVPLSAAVAAERFFERIEPTK